jgi:hypothetical protein
MRGPPHSPESLYRSHLIPTELGGTRRERMEQMATAKVRLCNDLGSNETRQH